MPNSSSTISRYSVAWNYGQRPNSLDKDMRPCGRGLQSVVFAQKNLGSLPSRVRRREHDNFGTGRTSASGTESGIPLEEGRTSSLAPPIVHIPLRLRRSGRRDVEVPGSNGRDLILSFSDAGRDGVATLAWILRVARRRYH